jgi:hypothetical protein
VEVIRPTTTLPASRMTRDRARIIETLELGRQAARVFLSAPQKPAAPASSSRPCAGLGDSADHKLASGDDGA